MREYKVSFIPKPSLEQSLFVFQAIAKMSAQDLARKWTE